MKYRPDIDGLRAIAVLPVIFFHAGFSIFSGGYVGVDVFFVISGFLITGIIIHGLSNHTFQLSDFYERRLRRILPALFFIMLICIPVSYLILLPDQMTDFGQSVMAATTYWSNILFWQESGYFDTAVEMKPLLHTWSLAVEEQFYIIFPCVLLIAWRMPRALIIGLLCFGFLASLALGQWGALYKPIPAFYLLPTRAWELIMGSLTAFYMARVTYKQTHDYTAQIGSCIGLALIVIAVFGFSPDTPFPGLYALTPTMGAVLIIIFTHEKTWIYKALSHPYLVMIGLISYSAYLWHYPLFAFARAMTSPYAVSLWVSVALTIVTFPLAFLTWRYIETPFRNQEFLSKTQVFSMAIVASLLFVIIGVGIYMFEGNLGRYTDKDMALISGADQHGDYVWSLKNALNKKQFDDVKAYNILVIGDSHSADFMNALSHARGYEQLSVRSMTINVECGNLYLDPDAFKHLVPVKRHAVCRNTDTYFGHDERDLIQQADRVVLASNWYPWEIAQLDRSIKRLRHEFGDKFMIAGNKHVEFHPRKIIKDNLIYTVPVHTDVENNREIKAIAGNGYINMYEYMCPDNTCPIAGEDGVIISYDGFHFSKSGATFVGRNMDINTLFSFNKDVSR